MTNPDKPKLTLADVAEPTAAITALKTIVAGIIAMRALGPVHGRQKKGVTIMVGDQILPFDDADVRALDEVAQTLTGSTGELLEAFDAGTPEGRGRIAATLLALALDTASEADCLVYFTTLGTVIPGLTPQAAPGSKPLMVQYVADVMCGIRKATKDMGRQD